MSSRPHIDLDQAATTPLSAEVRAAMEPWSAERYGNPSSRHPLGVAAARALDEAHAAVLGCLALPGDRVAVTSGGTEANNLAVIGGARAGRRLGKHVLVGATEHASVLQAALALRDEGFEVDVVPPPESPADVPAWAEHVRADTVLVAQMHVNNELGTVYPVASQASALRARSPGAWVHVDAVQSLGKLEVALGELDADSMTLSAHKLGGPKGAGALLLRSGRLPRPLLHGGGQEGGLRAGTENVAAQVGLATAVVRAVREQPRAHARLTQCNRQLRQQLTGLAGIRPVREERTERPTSPAILALLVPGPPAEVWLHHLAEACVYASVGSACVARRGDVSSVLRGLGWSTEQARQVLRLSFCTALTSDQVAAAAKAFADVHGVLAPMASVPLSRGADRNRRASQGRRA